MTVIVPVYNGSMLLPRCLDAIKSSTYRSYEIIVVDDGSTDESVEIGRQRGARVFRMPHRSGPAAARNYGSQKARGQILVFVDADVVVQPNSLARLASDFDKRPDIVAVFGSYDESPAEKNFLSQYKNLYHHFVHQSGSEDAATFWAGCGAVRRSVFESIKGFDSVRYSRPCIEDIELGYRLRALGHKIFLDKALQCKHLKRWTFESLLRADIFHRAIPWSRLVLESPQIINDLNLKTKDRISTALVGLSVIAIPLSLWKPQLLILISTAGLIVLILNHRLFRFFLRSKGPRFVVLAFFMQLLHYCYSGGTFGLCWIKHITSGRRQSTGLPLNQEKPSQSHNL